MLISSNIQRSFGSLSPNHLQLNEEYRGPINPTAADEAFNAFRIDFPYTKCRVVEDEMVYSFRTKGVMRAKELAERIINSKNLPLIVVQSNFFGERLIIKYVDGISACKSIMKRA
jgi:hypothetical protein